ncbi:Protein-S-isoprenylcysteine O-methyltransferase [Balamuthia mandrillaris]
MNAQIHQVVQNVQRGIANPLFSKYGHGTIACLAYFLGLVGGGGLLLALYSDSLWNLGLYLVFLSVFHFTEYLSVTMFNPQVASAESFLLNHSVQYTTAIVASLVEYLIEWYLFPEGLKTFWPVVYVGVLVALFGQAIRLLALITAAHNFTHEIAEEKKKEHVLVTTGIYGVVRHPGYFGWFWWSVATQVVLFNPICIAGFAYASWTFFEDRIKYEEEVLIEFFGNDYKEYRSKVPTYIPLIP